MKTVDSLGSFLTELSAVVKLGVNTKVILATRRPNIGVCLCLFGAIRLGGSLRCAQSAFG